MRPVDNPCPFAGNPLDRASEMRADPSWIKAAIAETGSVVLPLYRGDPLIADGKTAWLSTAAMGQFPSDAESVFLGVSNGRAHFAIDASAAALPETAPFADIGQYMPLREAAGLVGEKDLAIIGQSRWLLDWHRRHRFCAMCGGETSMQDGGGKRSCGACGGEHFPRSDPVAIVLAIHDGACLLGRGPHIPAPFMSALAGFIEAAETPEECAVRELYEEAGVTLTDVRYQFSQPWPFPSSLMMGFIADANDRALKLDDKEIVEARWLSREEVILLLQGEQRDDVRLPPRFTIARQLIERWAAG